jgi:hypothetical protein
MWRKVKVISFSPKAISPSFSGGTRHAVYHQQDSNVLAAFQGLRVLNKKGPSPGYGENLMTLTRKKAYEPG